MILDFQLINTKLFDLESWLSFVIFESW
jgi:hypothetical protein